MNKYHAKKTEVDGIVFDSKREAQRYCELKLLLKAGAITDLICQHEFTILPAFQKNGVKHRAITYKADFSYIENGKRVVEDVKGVKTKEFRIKHKLFEYAFPTLTLKII